MNLKEKIIQKQNSTKNPTNNSEILENKAKRVPLEETQGFISIISHKNTETRN